MEGTGNLKDDMPKREYINPRTIKKKPLSPSQKKENRKGRRGQGKRVFSSVAKG